MDKSIRAAGLLVLIVCLIGCGASEPTRKAPDIVFESVSLPVKTTKLSDYKGRIVLVDFWATWCGPCVQSMPLIQRMHDKYKDNGLVVLGVTDEGRFTVSEFLQKLKVKYTILLDTNRTSLTDYELETIPALFLIDKEGAVVYSHRGAPQDTVELESEIEKLLPR